MKDLSIKFVGRESEIQCLHNYAQLLSRGQGVVVGLKGTAGCGKSTLMHFFINELQETGDRDFEVLIGHCIDSEAMPYLPFVEAMRKYFNVSGVDQARSTERVANALLGISKDIVGLAPVVGPLLTVGVSIAEHTKDSIFSSQVEVEAGRRELFYAILQILSAISEKRKLLLVFEDMHWADGATIYLLQYLARKLRDKPVFILLTFRPILQDQGNSTFYTVWNRLLQKGLAREILLGNFDDNEFDEYLTSFFQGDLISEDIRSVLFAQTGGNPLFVSKTLTLLLREKLIVKDRGVWKETDPGSEFMIPRSVEATVQDILLKLTPKTQDALEIAAVIGQRFEYPILASASDMPELDIDEQIDCLTATKLVTELPETIDVYEFIHAIVRDVVYRRTGPRRRRRIHLIVAQTIEQVYGSSRWDLFEKLAYHYKKGGEMGKSVGYYLKATNKAISLLAYDDALRYCQQALDILQEDDPRFLSTLELAGKLADCTSQWQLARVYFGRLLEIAKQRGDLREMGEAYEGIASVHFREGRWTEAETASKKHLRIAGEIKDEKERASALFNLGQVHWRTGRWQEAQKSLVETLKIYFNLRTYNRVPAVIAVLGVLYRNQGQYRKALELYQRGIALSEKHKHLERYWLGRIYNNKGTVLRSMASERDMEDCDTESSLWDQAVKAYQSSLEIMRKIGSLRDVGNTFNNLAVVYSTRPKADLKKAMDYCQKAEQYLSGIDSPVDLLDNLRNRGKIHVQMGNFEKGRRNLEKSLSIANRIDAINKVGLAYIEIGRLYDQQGLSDKAREYYELAREQLAELGASPCLKQINYLLKQLDAQ